MKQDSEFVPSQAIGKTDAPDSPLFESEEEANRFAQATCTHNGSTYQKGATVCINHVPYKCGNNGWFKNGTKC
jgi:hypothetical protein